MADFISTSPDFSHYPLTPKVEVVSSISENQKLGNIIIDTKNKTAVILVSAEARQQSKELKKEIEYSNKEITFLKKLYSTTNNNEIKSSIEHKTIKIYEIEGTEKIAVSLDSKNVDFIFNEDGTEYFDLKWRREDKDRYASFKGLTGIEEITEKNKSYIVYEGNRYEVFSKDYFALLLRRIKFINSFSDTLMSIDFDKKD